MKIEFQWQSPYLFIILGAFLGSFLLVEKTFRQDWGTVTSKLWLNFIQLILLNLVSASILYFLAVRAYKLLEAISETIGLEYWIATAIGIAISMNPPDLSLFSQFMQFELESIPAIGQILISILSFYSQLKQGIIINIQKGLAQISDRLSNQLVQKFLISPQLEQQLKNRIDNWQDNGTRQEYQDSFAAIISRYASNNEEKFKYLSKLMLNIYTHKEIEQILRRE